MCEIYLPNLVSLASPCDLYHAFKRQTDGRTDGLTDIDGLSQYVTGTEYFGFLNDYLNILQTVY